MGFFTASPKPVIDSKPEDAFTYEENYIQRALRLPSASDAYENDAFSNYFQGNLKSNLLQDYNQSKEEEIIKNPIQVNEKIRTHRFSKLFRRRDKETHNKVQQYDTINQLEENPDSTTPNPLGRHPSVRVVERSVSSDDNSSIQDSNVGEDNRGLHSFAGYFWRLGRRQGTATANLNKSSTNRSVFRSLFCHSKLSGSTHDTIRSPGISSSVYEVKETLTQRYLNNGYENLLNDMDAVPFDLTLKEDNSLHTKVTKALYAMSPTKKSESGSAVENSFDEFTDESSWNPYIHFPEVKKEGDSTSTTSSEIKLSNKQNTMMGVQGKSSIFGSIKRCLSFRSREKMKSSFSSKSSRKGGGQKPVRESQDKSQNRNASSQKETLSSLFGPEENIADNVYSDSSSDSSNTATGDAPSAFGKLYAKTLDATEDKNIQRYNNDENLSGSTKFNSPENGDGSSTTVQNIGSSSPKSKSANAVYQNIVTNFASIENETYNSEDVSAFLQEYYKDPTRPSTKEGLIQKRTPTLSRSSSARLFGSMRGNPFQINTLKDPRPFTACDQYLKQVEKDKQELEELTTLIKRDRSRHKKVLNGIRN